MSTECGYFSEISDNSCKASPKRIIIFILAILFLLLVGVFVFVFLFDVILGLVEVPSFLGGIAEYFMSFAGVMAIFILCVVAFFYLRKK